MPPKKSDVKCFDKTSTAGKKYTTCMDSKTGKQLRKAPAKPAAKKAPAKKKLKIVPKGTFAKAKAEAKKPAAKKPAAKKPKSPLRGGVGLRPEISKLVQDFARPTGMVSNLMEKIVKAKGSLDRKARLLDKYNNIYNKQQPFLFPRELKKEGKEYQKVIDNIIRFRKKRDTLRKAQATEVVDVGAGLKSKRLIQPLNPEYVVEDAKIKKDLEDAEDLSRSMGYSLSLGKDKHVLSPDIWGMKWRVRIDGKRTNFKRDILDVMRNKIDGSLLIKILRSVAQELKV